MRGIEPSPTEGSAFVRQTDPDTRLMVVDGQRLFRNAVRMVTMELCPQVEMVAEAENRREAMRLARRLKPQLILLSVQPTEEDTFLAIRSLRRAVPDCRIVIPSRTKTPPSLSTRSSRAATATSPDDARRPSSPWRSRSPPRTAWSCPAVISLWPSGGSGIPTSSDSISLRAAPPAPDPPRRTSVLQTS